MHDMQWLALNGIARIDPSSEAGGFPIEGPLSSPPEGEWRAAEPVAQVIRLQFLTPTAHQSCRGCTFEQTTRSRPRMLRVMELQHIKMTVSGLWVLIAVFIAIVADLSAPGLIALAGVGLLPPLALLLLWNDPAQTISESIHEARR
jgi:hypothetical protein